MTERERLLQVARAQLGTAEDPLGSNHVRYNTDYYGRAVYGDAYPWCMAFVWWCFREAELSDLFYDGKKTASCTTLMKWAKAQGRFVTGPLEAGDVIFYDFDDDPYWSEHTGIYTGEVDSKGRYLVIEGNHNNQVALVARSESLILGAYRPAWRDVSEPDTQEEPAQENVPEGAVALPEIVYGDTGECVRAMQILLVGRGYKLRRYGADGDYGAETGTALRAYQSAVGLTADGICGPKTWAKLLGVM